MFVLIEIWTAYNLEGFIFLKRFSPRVGSVTIVLINCPLEIKSKLPERSKYFILLNQVIQSGYFIVSGARKPQRLKEMVKSCSLFIMLIKVNNNNENVCLSCIMILSELFGIGLGWLLRCNRPVLLYRF